MIDVKRSSSTHTCKMYLYNPATARRHPNTASGGVSRDVLVLHELAGRGMQWHLEAYVFLSLTTSSFSSHLEGPIEPTKPSASGITAKGGERLTIEGSGVYF